MLFFKNKKFFWVFFAETGAFPPLSGELFLFLPPAAVFARVRWAKAVDLPRRKRYNSDDSKEKR